ncbi:hypothetical protein KQI42_09650 [Tissierella sp. MSJ-40]|uniref:Uncharacterized protein n=1 Tax=Tissierella simiarum TaxID=2841534 RepID=A0ABS6E5R9_9FIRM|nr:hypothetical protein [Tissierella simiarum]MBU5438273.1 hypothetical protein [Tissierella simiarum]
MSKDTSKHRKGINKGKKKKFEFSKTILLLVLSTYFVGVFVGVKIVFIDFSQLGVVLAFIGTPTAAAIAFYCWKAKAENILKIKQENPEISGSPLDFNDISQ